MGVYEWRGKRAGHIGRSIVVPTTPSPGTPAPTRGQISWRACLLNFSDGCRTSLKELPMPTSENDLGAVLQQAMKVLQNVEQQRAAGDATATPQQQAEQI